MPQNGAALWNCVEIAARLVQGEFLKYSFFATSLIDAWEVDKTRLSGSSTEDNYFCGKAVVTTSGVGASSLYRHEFTGKKQANEITPFSASQSIYSRHWRIMAGYIARADIFVSTGQESHRESKAKHGAPAFGTDRLSGGRSRFLYILILALL